MLHKRKHIFLYQPIFNNGTMEENEINLILQLYNTLNVKSYN